MSEVAKNHNTIHWFRKGLRLHDNPALLHAVSTSKIVYPVFIFDKKFLEKHDTIGSSRMLFLFDCLNSLKEDLQKIGSNLYIFYGDTISILKEKVQQWKITQLSFIKDTELFYHDRDRYVVAALEELGAVTVPKSGHTLYDIEEILEVNGGKPPLTFSSFLCVLNKLKGPPLPVETITEKHFRTCSTPYEENHDQTNRCPTLQEFGLEELPEPSVWHGGEKLALERMEKRLISEGWILPGSSDGSINNNALLPRTTGLSPYFSWGCLSARHFYHTVGNIKSEARKHCFTPLSLQRQLYWRDFFYTVSARTPNFTVMKGNPICLQVEWKTNPQQLELWKIGMTGFPWIDAIMRQLRKEGWIHQLARHSVASFLTRGDLWLNWEEGQKVFEHYLIDSDFSLNAGNWMWLSASAFSHQYTSIFHPVKFGKRTDPTGHYIRRYVKELQNFPSKYIYDPWNAPIEIQKEFNCIIGQDYPFPMVDHAKVSAENLKKLNELRRRQAKIVELTADRPSGNSGEAEKSGPLAIKRAYDSIDSTTSN